jgi:hypothetical protein
VTIIRNKPSQLIFMIPANLPPGSYSIEVRAVFGDKGAVRTGTLPAKVTVPGN